MAAIFFRTAARHGSTGFLPYGVEIGPAQGYFRLSEQSASAFHDRYSVLLKTAALSAEALASVLAQSVDCVKLMTPDGNLLWMNPNGLRAMEIDDFSTIDGQPWQDLWPDATRPLIADALPAAAAGEVVRFDAFCPTAKGAPRWWNVTVSSVTDNAGQNTGFLAISRDITEAETGRQALLIAATEMRHRLKNTYAMIGSLLNGFARGNEAHEQFARDMQSRLVSLSTAQALFAADDAPCEIATLIPALIEPFRSPACEITVRPIAVLSVPQGQADAIALVLGELAVNSAKHGALGKGGTIDLAAGTGSAILRVVWEERSATAILARERAGGQGLQLIERIVRARAGTIAIAWQDYGLTVTLEFPIEADRRIAAAMTMPNRLAG